MLPAASILRHGHQIDFLVRHRFSAPLAATGLVIACVSAWGPDADRHRKYLI